MIEYWEAVGRLATYAGLSREFENLDAIKKTRQPVKIYTDDGTCVNTGLQIDEVDFVQVQTLIRSVLTEQSISLIAAGELIWDFSFPDSATAIRTLNDTIPTIQPDLYGPSTAYFTGLGRIIADWDLRQKLVANPGLLADTLPRLSSREQAQLSASLANPTFIAACDQFSKSGSWDDGCLVGGGFTVGYMQPTGMRAVQRGDKFYVVKANAWGPPAAGAAAVGY